MLSFFQTHARGIFLLLFIFLGFSCGRFAATLAERALSPGVSPRHEGVTKPSAEGVGFQANSSLILKRNVFGSVVRTSIETEGTEGAVGSTISRGDLYLYGTVSSSNAPFAMIRLGEKTEIFHEGDSLPGRGTVHRITRNLVLIREDDGSLSSLLMPGESGMSVSSPSGTEEGAGVRKLGENRWIIDRLTAEDARQNIGELLKSARIEPNVIEGQTDGFTVKMIRSGSLLSELGLRVGDIIKRINGLDLNSPEKALQIFQQLREARNLILQLERNGAPMNFQYEVN